MTSTDRSHSRAILIGTSRYTHLPEVTPALNSLHRMHSVLTGELCAWPADRVTMFANREEPGDLPHRLVEILAEAEDVALFYYVGHGQIDTMDMLCLGLTGTRTTPASQLRTTGLSFDAVRYALRMSPAKAKILILDCCFAGLATTGRLGARDVQAQIRATGAYTMAAAGEFEQAWYDSDAGVPAPQTYFTRYLLDVIEYGIPGEGPELKLEPIFSQASHALARDGKPTPTSSAAGTAPQIVFALNAAPASSDNGEETDQLYLPDYASSRAILIGAASYADVSYSPLPAATQSLQELAATLSEDVCGWPTDRVTVLADPVNATQVLQAIRRAARETSDVLLICFAGHAAVTLDGRLTLAIVSTDSADADITGIEYERIRDALKNSPARVKVVMLDCDYADQATADGASYLLTATGTGTPLARQLAGIIRDGVPHGPRLLTLPRLYTELRRRLAEQGRPIPRQRLSDDADQVAFARNAALTAPPRRTDSLSAGTTTPAAPPVDSVWLEDRVPHEKPPARTSVWREVSAYAVTTMLFALCVFALFRAVYGTTLDLDTTLRENTSQGIDAASNFFPTVIAWIVAVLTGPWLWRRRRRHGWRWQQPVVVVASTLLILTGPMTILLTVNGALTTPT